LQRLIDREDFEHDKIINYVQNRKFPRVIKKYRDRIVLFEGLKADHNNRIFLQGVNAERRPLGLYTDDEFNTRQYLKRLSYQVFHEDYENHA